MAYQALIDKIRGNGKKFQAEVDDEADKMVALAAARSAEPEALTEDDVVPEPVPTAAPIKAPPAVTRPVPVLPPVPKRGGEAIPVERIVEMLLELATGKGVWCWPNGSAMVYERFLVNGDRRIKETVRFEFSAVKRSHVVLL